MQRQIDRAGATTSGSDDRLLLARAASGDADALGLLYDRYGRLVFSLSLRITGDRGSAEEVTQDTFMRLWRHAGRFEAERGSVVSWLLTMARRIAIDEVRSRRSSSRRREVELPDELLHQEAIDPAVLAQLRVDLQRALAEIPAAQRETIELLFFGGLSRQELAQRLGSPLPTIHTRVRLAMEKLRALLLNNDPGQNE